MRFTTVVSAAFALFSTGDAAQAAGREDTMRNLACSHTRNVWRAILMDAWHETRPTTMRWNVSPLDATATV